MDVDPGFATSQIVTAQVNPPRARYADADRQRALARQVVERLGAAPGVTAAAVTTQLPFDQTNHGMAMWVDGWTKDPNKLVLIMNVHTLAMHGSRFSNASPPIPTRAAPTSIARSRSCAIATKRGLGS